MTSSYGAMPPGGAGQPTRHPAIQVADLSKTYGSHTAVDGISFTVPAGSVTGFLGPNGAGKSTTLRMLVGLTRPTSGVAHVCGRPFTQLPNPGRRVGVLLDAAAQHTGRTGVEELRLAAFATGVPVSRVDEVIELVGLTAQEARVRIRTYSLGMRQRLGIALALVADPQVLILDEPANGLDPAGIHWMRSLLRDFADQGGTVLLSSHLLREVEVVADNLVVIGRGKIVVQGSKQQLLAGSGTFVRSSDDQRLTEALTAAGIVVRPADGGYVTEAGAEQVARVAARADVALLELRTGGGLEELFLQLTADNAREQVRT